LLLVLASAVTLESALSDDMSGLSFNSLYSAQLKLKLIYDRQSDGQSVLVPGANLGPVTNFSFAMKFPVDSCGFVIL
jgi:hypothetical protein